MLEKKKIDYNQLAGHKINRVESLCDGVFAIAMTILVLDVRIPLSAGITTEGELFTQFWNITPTLLSYFMSFLTLGIYWTAHSLQFSYINKCDRNLSWISIFYLMFIALLPFTTSFLSEHIHYKFSILLYWLNILIPGLIMLVHWNYAYSHGYVNQSVTDKVLIDKVIKRRIYWAQAAYAIAAALCFISIYLSIIGIILIQLNFALAFGYNRATKN